MNWYSRQNHKDAGGYIQWKPVCYLDAHRARDKGTEVQYYGLTGTQHIDDILNTSVAFAYFGDRLYTDKNVVRKASNISFGFSNDGFYVGSNYTAWWEEIEVFCSCSWKVILVGIGMYHNIKIQFSS